MTLKGTLMNGNKMKKADLKDQVNIICNREEIIVIEVNSEQFKEILDCADSKLNENFMKTL